MRLHVYGGAGGGGRFPMGEVPLYVEDIENLQDLQGWEASDSSWVRIQGSEGGFRVEQARLGYLQPLGRCLMFLEILP